MFVDIIVAFAQSAISVKESEGSVQLSMVLSKAIQCCTISILVTCENINTTGKLFITYVYICTI